MATSRARLECPSDTSRGCQLSRAPSRTCKPLLSPPSTTGAAVGFEPVDTFTAKDSGMLRTGIRANSDHTTTLLPEGGLAFLFDPHRPRLLHSWTHAHRQRSHSTLHPGRYGRSPPSALHRSNDIHPVPASCHIQSLVRWPPCATCQAFRDVFQSCPNHRLLPL